MLRILTPLGIGLSFVAGVLFTMSVYEDGTTRSWLYDCQTPVTGVLAVLAAFITINVMNRTNKAADKRHEDLMKFKVGLSH